MLYAYILFFIPVVTIYVFLWVYREPYCNDKIFYEQGMNPSEYDERSEEMEDDDLKKKIF